MMANSSEEGSGEGLGWINARVKKFRSLGFDCKNLFRIWGGIKSILVVRLLYLRI